MYKYTRYPTAILIIVREPKLVVVVNDSKITLVRAALIELEIYSVKW